MFKISGAVNAILSDVQGAFLNNHRFQKGAVQDHKSPPVAVYSQLRQYPGCSSRKSGLVCDFKPAGHSY